MHIITDLLEKKHCLFRELKENMQEFRASLERGDEAGMERLNREREDLIRAIDGLDAQLTRAGFSGGFGMAGAGRVGGSIGNWIERIKEVWQEVFQLNLVCLEYAEIRCRDLKAEMATMGREVQTVRKYLTPSPRVPRFIDMVK